MHDVCPQDRHCILTLLTLVFTNEEDDVRPAMAVVVMIWP